MCDVLAIDECIVNRIANNIDEEVYTMNKEEFYFQWHFTNHCNLRCSHCYQEGYHYQDLIQSAPQDAARLPTPTVQR